MSRESLHLAKHRLREADIRALACRLAGVDPLESPSTYARLLGRLVQMKATHARFTALGPADQEDET